MRFNFRKKLNQLLLGFLPLIFLSCSSGGGGDEPTVKYDVEIEGTETGCLERIKYIDEDGRERTHHTDDSTWSYRFDAGDGAHLYLCVEVSCNKAIAQLYLNGDRVKRETDYRKAEIDGHLRIDAEGNPWFEEED
jgi:hypothetical protein